jgi:hypothetical protein
MVLRMGSPNHVNYQTLAGIIQAMGLNCPHPLGRGPSIWPLLIKKRLFSKPGQKGWSYPYPV